MKHNARGYLAVLGVAGALLATGCGDDGESLADLPAADSGDQDDGTPETGDVAADTDGFDECSLVPPEELAQVTGFDEMHITGRGASPQPDDGGWSLGCSYGQRGVPGVGEMQINVYTEADRDTFFEWFQGRVAQEVAVGDYAQRVDSPAGAGSTTELRAIQGGQGIELVYLYYGEQVDMPGPDDVMSSGLPELVLERLPEEIEVTEMSVEGPCAAVDVAQAAQVLGGDLPGGRSVLGDAGSASCDFHGVDVSLTVAVITDPKKLADVTMPPESINVTDLGDGAVATVYQDDLKQTDVLEVVINDRDRVVAITAEYTPDLGPISEPRPEDIEMARDILSAIS